MKFKDMPILAIYWYLFAFMAALVLVCVLFAAPENFENMQLKDLAIAVVAMMTLLMICMGKIYCCKSEIERLEKKVKGLEKYLGTDVTEWD